MIIYIDTNVIILHVDKKDPNHDKVIAIKHFTIKLSPQHEEL